MTDNERAIRRLVYAGRRLTGGKAIHVWYDVENLEYDETLSWSTLKGVSVGGLYEVEARAENRDQVYPATLTYTGGRIDDETQRALWQAADRDANDTLQARAAERRHGKSPDLDAALEPLLNLARQSRTRHDAAALARIASERIAEAYWRK